MFVHIATDNEEESTGHGLSCVRRPRVTLTQRPLQEVWEVCKDGGDIGQCLGWRAAPNQQQQFWAMAALSALAELSGWHSLVYKVWG